MRLVLEIDTSNMADINYVAGVVHGLLASHGGVAPPAEPAAPVIPASIRRAPEAPEKKIIMEWPENKAVMAAPERSAPTSQQLSASIDAAAAEELGPPLSNPAETNEVSRGSATAEATKPKRTKPPVSKTLTIDEVRAIMVEKAKQGPAEMDRQRTILTGMGFGKLSDVPPEKLMELKEKIEKVA